jgi:branched-chain amino acid transport system substrate-binding protein
MGEQPRRYLTILLMVLALAGSAACTEEGPGATSATPAVTDDGDLDGAGSGADGDTVVGRYAGEAWFDGAVPTEATVATGDPIRIGHINQEDVPFGSFPEVRMGAEAAVAFINAELGGIGGRPVELVTCIADFSPEGSQNCAQEMVRADVVAVVGGIDIMSSASIPVLEQNQIPYIGGIPVNFDEMDSPISFQFSGGSPGAMAAFASDAIDRGYDHVAVAYADFGPIESAALDFGVRTLEEGGVATVRAVSYPLMAPDLLPTMNQLARGEPDAIFMFATDADCARVMNTRIDLGITAELYMVGACAAPPILEEAGDAADGVIFNIEGPLDMDTGVVDGELYLEASARYGPAGFEPTGAGTVTFRAVMNLWSVANEIGADDLDTAAVIDAMRAARDRPSYDGHPYTCDGRQVPGLMALCAPQQVLIAADGDGFTMRSDGWIDVAALLADRD